MSAVMSRPKAKAKEPTRRDLLRGLYFGPVLNDIAEQVWVKQPDGSSTRYPTTIWHAWLKKELRVPSTTALSDDEFHLYILQAQAGAARALGVTFTERPEPVSQPAAEPHNTRSYP